MAPLDSRAWDERKLVSEIFKQIEGLLIFMEPCPERTRAAVKVEETFRYLDVAIRAGSADRYTKSIQVPNSILIPKE